MLLGPWSLWIRSALRKLSTLPTPSMMHSSYVSCGFGIEVDWMDIHLRPMSPAVFFSPWYRKCPECGHGRERIKETFLMPGRSVGGCGGICCGGSDGGGHLHGSWTCRKGCFARVMRQMMTSLGRSAVQIEGCDAAYAYFLHMLGELLVFKTIWCHLFQRWTE